MLSVTDREFQHLINQALNELPKEHVDHIRNVAIVYADEPTAEQREQLALRDDETLFGLYEGVPLAFRQGETRLLPDKITIFKNPICRIATDKPQLREEIKHTLWHEIAHYYGLNHDQIRHLE